MQEEVENRTLTLIINGTKFSASCLSCASRCSTEGREALRIFRPAYSWKAAIGKYLAHRKGKKQRTDRDVTPHGKQSVKKLTRQGEAYSPKKT